MRTRVAIAAAAVVGVGVAGVGGIFAAAASGNSKDAAEHGVEVTTDPTGAQEQVYLLGPLTGVPSAKQISDTQDEWTFTDGTLIVEHTVKHENDTFDPNACTARLDETGTWHVVSGTGAYAHTQGHGTYVFRGHGSSAPGTCGPSTQPTSFLGIVVADGQMSV